MDNQLQKGDEISPTLIKAIEDSHVSIVVFSENYASSRWCLGELSKIMKCKKVQGQIVIPIFYNIDPSHVRKQTGSYKQDFENHEGERNCIKWKTALTEAANLVGWDSRNRIEPEFLKDIVEDVLHKLARKYPNQLKGLIGIEESYEEIKSLLEIGSSDAKTLGIWGMGGIGKTTLATALYKNLSHQFEGHCFLANVREKLNKFEVLRNELFSKLLGNKNHGFDNFDITRLQRTKVFIVLDDVATSEHWKKLIVEHDFLSAGSRVIITTRNKQIVSQLDMKGLTSHHSLQLFCLNVFGEKQPKSGYEDLSRRVISYCKGIPLALEVLGKNLCKRSNEAWECELRKLQEIPNMEIHEVLKLSYDDLDHYQKDIFLDIACFFKGENRDLVTWLLYIFKFFPKSGIEVLLDKALITISSYDEIQMHDLIQDMGRKIVHQESIKDPGRRNRLWRPNDVLDVLKYNKGTDVVEGINLDLYTLTDDLYLSSDCLAKMTNLRFLRIYRGPCSKDNFNVHLPKGLESLPYKLRYLHWDEYCLESLPPDFCAEELVKLQMHHSKLRKLWNTTKSLGNLMEIDIHGSKDLIEIPDLSMAKKLVRVDLSYCKSLRELHPSLSFLPKLTIVDLRYCKQIESINVHSKSLKILNLSGCSSLKSINVHSKSLEILNLSGCYSLKVILITSEKMTDLELSLLVALSSVTLSLPNLTYMRLSNCRVMESFNLNLVTSEKMSLKELDLTRTQVKSLPANIKNLSMLRKLTLNDCFELVDLPELPSSLVSLYLHNCMRLNSLPGLPPSLHDMTAFNCISLETNITQQLVLQHMLQSHIPSLHQKFLNGDPGFYDHHIYPYHFIFPGNQIMDECGFRTVHSSITIPYLPKSDLVGIICCCIVFSNERNSSMNVNVDTCHDMKVCRRYIRINCTSSFFSNHMLFSYVDVSQIDKISVYDHFNNTTLKFRLISHDLIIQECGIFPVYDTASGLKLVSSSKEIEIGVRGSNSENEQEPKQSLPATKRSKTS